MAKKKATIAGEPTPQFDLITARKIAEDATLFTSVTQETNLEDANLRTPKERELYALRVIESVAEESFKMKKNRVPQKASTLVGEVTDAIVIFAVSV